MEERDRVKNMNLNNNYDYDDDDDDQLPHMRMVRRNSDSNSSSINKFFYLQWKTILVSPFVSQPNTQLVLNQF